MQVATGILQPDLVWISPVSGILFKFHHAAADRTGGIVQPVESTGSDLLRHQDAASRGVDRGKLGMPVGIEAVFLLAGGFPERSQLSGLTTSGNASVGVAHVKSMSRMRPSSTRMLPGPCPAGDYTIRSKD